MASSPWRMLLVLLSAAASVAPIDSRLVAARSQQSADTVQLAAESRIERFGASGDVHHYEVNLAEGDYFEVAVTQDHLYVSLSITGPEDPKDTIIAVNVQMIASMTQRLGFVAASVGVHRLSVTITGTRGEVSHTKPRSYHLDVIAMRPAMPQDHERAQTFVLMARASRAVAEHSLDGIRRAIPVFEQAATEWRALGDRMLEATTLFALMGTSNLFTQFRDTATEHGVRLAALLAELDLKTLEQRVWETLAFEYHDGGHLTEAIDAATRSVTLARSLQNRAQEGASLRLLSWLQVKLGQYENARRTASEALDIAASIGDRGLEAHVLINVARLHELAGDLDTAGRHYERALALAEGTRPILGQVQLFLGNNRLNRGDIDGAQRAFEARLTPGLHGIQRDDEAAARILLGDVRLTRGDLAGARELYEAAHKTLTPAGFPDYLCACEERLGKLALLEGRNDLAEAHLQRALAISKESTSAECEARGRAGLADAAAARGDLEVAEQNARVVVDLTNRSRDAVAGLEARSFGFPELAPVFERAVDVTMRRGEGDATGLAIAAGLALNEQALARGLFDALSAERVEKRAEIPAELDAARRRLRETWRTRALEHGAAAVRSRDAKRRVQLADEMTTLSAQLREVESRIDLADPLHASFVRPAALDAAAIQSLLDADTTLVEYALGEARSFAWVVTTRSIHAVTLPPRREIATLARRVRDVLASAPQPGGGSPAVRSGNHADVLAMSRMILDPVMPLVTTPRVAIVTPGPLALIPFNVMPVLSKRTDGARVEGPVLSERAAGTRQPMLLQFEIVNLPSATVLSALRRAAERRTPPSRGIAVFADPVYDVGDPRILALGSKSPETPATRSSDEAIETTDPLSGWRSARADGTSMALRRLPFSRQEADAITAFALKQSLKATGFDATRERALDATLASYRFVHFATHGLVDPSVPNLSGLALSFVDRQRRARNGLLLLPDVYEMRLNADVVVLSGCETALGTEVRGEGLMGLTRGFMYAGAARVVSSLWRVDDAATSALMTAFYRGMLRDKRTPAAALRAAQLEISKTARWSAPYFWAGFVLHGDWR